MRERPIAIDSIRDVCEKKNRRIILEVLVEEQEPLTVNDLSKAIFTRNRQANPDGVSETGLTEIRLSLTHLDLPILASKGFINYNRRHKRVELTEQLDPVQPTLSTMLAANPSAKAPTEL